jgi:hypothetical protein
MEMSSHQVRNVHVCGYYSLVLMMMLMVMMRMMTTTLPKKKVKNFVDYQVTPSWT